MSDERLEWLGDMFIRLKFRDELKITFARFVEVMESDRSKEQHESFISLNRRK